MQETLDGWMRQRARELGLNLSALCKQAGIGRQTLYDLACIPDKLPSMQTVVALADVLQVHPLRILHLVFDAVPINPAVKRAQQQGDRSAFVRDVTAPDGALVLPGQRFTKTWELQNAGNVPWQGRFLQCMDEEVVVATRTGETLHLAHNLVPASSRIAVPTTAPGATVQLSVELTAPQTPGTVLSYWKSVFADGTLCFPDSVGVWVKVRVNTCTQGAFSGA
ncbi:MAG: NBR1-Ig-like domain-containing protein [Burkholderiales bacterium]|nr:NBR1-Ig-like domain-containing protein [Burkholderiales bacterium]